MAEHKYQGVNRKPTFEFDDNRQTARMISHGKPPEPGFQINIALRNGWILAYRVTTITLDAPYPDTWRAHLVLVGTERNGPKMGLN